MKTETKIKFEVGQSVATATAPGVIKQLALFADHCEYLVEFPDKTATWIHENNLKPNPPSAQTPNPKTK